MVVWYSGFDEVGVYVCITDVVIELFNGNLESIFIHFKITRRRMEQN